MGAPDRTGQAPPQCTQHRQPSRRDQPTVATDSACAAGSECGRKGLGIACRKPFETFARLAGCAFKGVTQTTVTCRAPAHARRPCEDTHTYTHRQTETHAANGQCKGSTAADHMRRRLWRLLWQQRQAGTQRGLRDAVVFNQPHTNTPHTQRHHKSSRREGNTAQATHEHPRVHTHVHAKQNRITTC